ncbi:MAG TPA: alanine--tRNA ligase [Myxococcota bacterium]|nr:alanine--tRNA ligase [Myxococcota bacterium]
MTGNEIRKAFLDYFAERGHSVQPSGPLVPQGDATLMFANAGMVQFKRVFTGEEKRAYSRAATSQKCMRVSGKHNDLEEVGRSPSHHTFFEMLGNFSFGDYFKRDAIDFAWDLLTRVFKLSPDDLVVSVHESDDEAYALWRDRIGLEPRRIFKLGDGPNFWEMGDTGPCGPCSEIHKITDRKVFEKGGDPTGPGFVEIWNLVFMQFDQRADGSRVPLPKPSIDTGMGLERITRLLQGKTSNYDTDLFRPLIRKGEELAGVRYGTNPDSDVSLRVVADHARACAFLVGDGVLPSNEGRGYVLRRVLRRAARHGVLLDIDGPFLHAVVDTVIDEMAEAYPDLAKRRAFVLDAVKKEEERFGKTLGRGLALLEEEVTRARRAKLTRLPGEVVFKLYDTFGFPTDLTEDILRGKGLDYERAAFDAAMREQAERARAAWKGSGQQAPAEVYQTLATQPTRFTGYESLEGKSRVRALLRDGAQVNEVAEGDRAELVVDVTPFYAESGGQVGDVGAISGPEGTLEVEDVQKPVEGLVVHQGRVALGRIAVGDEVTLRVDGGARAATVRNHSGTHLLQWALRDVLGPQVTQAGSLVAPDRLRFDFTHDAPLSEEQVRAVEDRVNALILANHTSRVEQKSYREAVDAGAIAMFTEKYGDRVRVVSFGPSTELCGGTHAHATGDIGSFRIVGQSAIGAGVRRIEAQTGLGALEHARRDARVLRDTAELLRTSPGELYERVTRLVERERELERELEKTRAQMRRGGAADPLARVKTVGGVKLLASEVEDATPKELRTLVDELKQRIGSGIVLLGVRHEGKAALALGVTQDLVGRFKAGDLVRELAKELGGTGGGRPDFAQAGGPDAAKLEAALAKLESAAGLGG